MKKIIISLSLLLLATFVLAGCDDVKQIISDIAEEEIETQVNDMLGLTEEDELFQLPAAKRYEDFSFDDKNPDKQLTKKYSDKTFIAVGILGIILCPIALFETIFSQNYIAMIIAYIVSAIVIVVLFVLTDKEHDKVEQLLPNIKK